MEEELRPLPSTLDRSPAVSAQNTCSGRRRPVPSGLCTGQQTRSGCREGQCAVASACCPGVALLSSPSQRGSGVGGLWEAAPQAPRVLFAQQVCSGGAPAPLTCPRPGVTRESCRRWSPVPTASGEPCRSPVRPQCSRWLPGGDQCSRRLSITTAVNHPGASSRT